MGDRTEGSCLCGAVRFEVEGPLDFCAHCHCTMCRRAHGAGFVTWVIVPRTRFRITAGEKSLTRFESSDHGVRSFCRLCGSSMFCESSHYPERIDVTLANLEDGHGAKPGTHVFFDDRATWTAISDDLPRRGGPTGFEPL